MKDERIKQVEYKIRSEIAIIIFIGAILSYLVKTLIFNMSLEEYITENVIILFFPLYQFVRMHMMKISIYSDLGNKHLAKKMMIITCIIVMIFSGLYIYYKMKASVSYEWESAVLGVFAFLVLFSVMFFIINRYNQHRGHKYDKEYDDK